MSGPNRLKLLVPTNFSSKSEMALDFALRHAAHEASQVYLFHVLEDVTKNYRRLDRLTEDLMERMRVQVMQALERLRGLGVTPNVDDVQRRMGSGKPAAEIFSAADGIQPDMIVMGAPTSNAFKKLVTHAPCTLVLVKEKGSE